jgi:integrase
MPLKLEPPRKGKSPYWRVRGTYLGQLMDKSTGTHRRALAAQILKKWEREVERGQLAEPGEATFLSAAVSYMEAGGDRRPMQPLLDHFGETPLRLIDQAAIDAAAVALMPDATPATRNREVYTPVSAVLERAGVEFKIKRPKGWRGKIVRRWLWPEQAFGIFEAARSFDPEFAIFLEGLCYTGLRLSELLALQCDDVRLSEAFAFVPDSKNGDPQPVYLPSYLVASLANHPRGLNRPGERVFRFHKGGGLDYLLMASSALACGLERPKRWKRGPRPERPKHELDWVTFHTFRRTYATWMRRYSDLDSKDLVDTGRWRTEESASRYAQVVTGEAAQRASLLPTPGAVENPWKRRSYAG